jgi:hypothetical protein
MCKATWHQDGTWPLLGADEEISPSSTTSFSSLIRSIHPSSKLLRPPGITLFELPSNDLGRGPPQRQEPSCEEVAASYRERGIQVDEAEQIDDEDW